ncbi:MAG: hypothetical protein ABEJ71_03050 [Halodesulfurarchaeum sp.]
MHRRWARLSGGASILGAVLAMVAAVPPSWYGFTPTDSYVFDPPMWSPLWINRELVPLVILAAAIGLLLGLIGLLRRDWAGAGRARRWGSVGAVIGFTGLTFTVPVFVFSMQGTPGGVLAILVALAAVVFGLIALLPSLLLLAYGYVKAGRPRIGGAFAGVLLGVPALGYLIPGPASSFVAMVPIAVAWVVFGLDLLRNESPLGGGSTASNG